MSMGGTRSGVFWPKACCWLVGVEGYCWECFYPRYLVPRTVIFQLEYLQFFSSATVGFSQCWHSPVDTGRKLNVHKTFRRRPGRFLNVLCTINLSPRSTGNGNSISMFDWCLLNNLFHNICAVKTRSRSLQLMRFMTRSSNIIFSHSEKNWLINMYYIYGIYSILIWTILFWYLQLTIYKRKRTTADKNRWMNFLPENETNSRDFWKICRKKNR